MFAFMATPVMNALGAKLSVYGFFKSDNVVDDDLAAIVPAAGALLAFSLVSLLYAGWLAYLQFKGGRLARWLSHYASALLYVIVLICTSVIAVKFNKYAGGISDVKGSFVGVTVAFTVIFLLLHAGALVGCKLLHIEDITDEERAQAKQRFDELVERCKQRQEARRQLHQYKAERKANVKQRIKTESCMRGRSAGAMCLIVFLCVAIGMGICAPVYVNYMLWSTDFDYLYEHSELSWSLERLYDDMKNNWDEENYVYLDIVRYQDYYVEQYAEYEKYLETYEGDEPTFDQWCNEQGHMCCFDPFLYDEYYDLGGWYSVDEDENLFYYANNLWGHSRLVPSELLEVDPEAYIQEHFPDGFADYIKVTLGVKASTFEELQANHKETYFYQDARILWERGAFYTDAIQGGVDIGVIAILGIATLLFGLWGCLASFRKKLHKSTLFGWLTVLCSCLLFVVTLILFLIGVYYASDMLSVTAIYYIFGAAAHWGMFPLAVIFAFCNVFILADDAIKARKRFSREYDEQKSAEGDVIALKLTSRKKSDDKTDLTETTEEDGE